MKKTRVSVLVIAFVAGMSTVALAQGGGGGGGGGGRNGRGGRGSTAYTSLLTTIHLTQAQQAQEDSIGKMYDSVANSITTAWNRANNGGAVARGGGGGGGRGGRGAFTPLPDSVQSTVDSVRKVRNAEMRKVLDPNQQKLFDDAVKKQADAAALARGGGGIKDEPRS